jgi:tripartite-type tricarboxylate transporter receptor subunit TctC
MYRSLLAAFFAACSSAAFAQAAGQAASTGPAPSASKASGPVYPTKPIRLLVPNAPGGSNSFVARLVGEKITASWGQPVLIDNRPGGHNVVSAEALLRSNPDGHTILFVTASHAINPWLFHNDPYEFLRDFAPVGSLTITQYILAVNAANVPATTLREFIAIAKSKPGQLNAAGSNTGGIQQIALELFNSLAGVKLNYVPYKGGGPGMTDLVGGHVQLAFNTAITFAPHLKSGKVRALAIGGQARSPVLPDVPTFTEAGVPGFDVNNWFGIVAPARTPKAIVQKLSDEIAMILNTPDVREKLVSQGAEPFVTNPQQFATFYKAEHAKFGRIIKTAGIKVEQ